MIALLAAAGCAPAVPAAPTCPPGQGELVWLSTSDFEVAALAALDPATGDLYDSLATTWTDAVVRAVDGTPIVLGRYDTDALREYADDRCFAEPSAEVPLPAGTNAHDIVAVGEERFVSAYESDHLVVLGPSGEPRGEVALGAWADTDGLPDPDALLAIDGEIVVALQNLLDGYEVAGTGRLAIVHAASLSVTRVFDVGPNPKLFAHPATPGTAVVLTGLYFDATDGALATIDLATGAIAVALTEADLGLDLSDYAEVAGRGVVVGVSEGDGSASELHCIDWATGDWTAGPVTSSWLADLAPTSDGLVWVAARSAVVSGAESGLFAIDPVTCDVVTSTVVPALEPYSLAVLP